VIVFAISITFLTSAEFARCVDISKKADISMNVLDVLFFNSDNFNKIVGSVGATSGSVIRFGLVVLVVGPRVIFFNCSYK